MYVRLIIMYESMISALYILSVTYIIATFNQARFLIILKKLSIPYMILLQSYPRCCLTFPIQHIVPSCMSIYVS